MIRYSSNTFRHRIALLCDGAKIRPEPCSNRGDQPRFAVFCAENIMDPNRTKGIGHRETYRIRKITTCKYVFYNYCAFTPALRDGGSLLVLEYQQPALKRRPIFKAPLRGASFARRADPQPSKSQSQTRVLGWAHIYG
jgi:hypothetical protein